MVALYLAALLLTPLVIASGIATIVGLPLLFVMLVVFLIDALFRRDAREVIALAYSVVMLGTLIAGFMSSMDPDAWAWLMVAELVIGVLLISTLEPNCEEAR